MNHMKCCTKSKRLVPKNLTFCAMKSTIRRARIRQPAAILEVRRFVDASMRAIPQNDEPRSVIGSSNKSK